MSMNRTPLAGLPQVSPEEEHAAKRAKLEESIGFEALEDGDYDEVCEVCVASLQNFAGPF